ncbi:hypothetical protein FKP32DRAFT_1590063 [Trametes sanguinea]|nr:hypothetical protein FKP32DRAFT_1590063 [Trametes sanguinea]
MYPCILYIPPANQSVGSMSRFPSGLERLNLVGFIQVIESAMNGRLSTLALYTGLPPRQPRSVSYTPHSVFWENWVPDGRYTTRDLLYTVLCASALYLTILTISNGLIPARIGLTIGIRRSSFG